MRSANFQRSIVEVWHSILQSPDGFTCQKLVWKLLKTVGIWTLVVVVVVVVVYSGEAG